MTTIQWGEINGDLLIPHWIDIPSVHNTNQAQRHQAGIEATLAAMHLRMVGLVAPTLRDANARRPTAATAATVHLNAAGRRIRARLALHAGEALGMADTDAVSLAAAAELLHNASLVHDDIQDRTVTRRGEDAIWLAFGTDIALCAGDLMLSAAYAALADLSTTARVPALIRLVHDRTGDAIRGQSADLAVRSSAELSVEEYSAIAAAKSGALLGLPLELVFIAVGDDGAAVHARLAATHFAIAYQIADDIVDLADDLRAVKPALNIVQVLGGGGVAIVQARSLGLAYLNSAAGLALDLPRGAGALLYDLVLRLSDSLSIVETSVGAVPVVAGP